MRQLSWPAFVWVERRPGGSRKQDRFHILPIENIDKRRQTTPFSGRSQTLRAQVTTINSRQRQVCINRAKKSVGCGFESHTTHFIRWSAACGPALTILVSLSSAFRPQDTQDVGWFARCRWKVCGVNHSPMESPCAERTPTARS
jgi:hypothetical protein